MIPVFAVSRPNRWTTRWTHRKPLYLPLPWSALVRSRHGFYRIRVEPIYPPVARINFYRSNERVKAEPTLTAPLSTRATNPWAVRSELGEEEYLNKENRQKLVQRVPQRRNRQIDRSSTRRRRFFDPIPYVQLVISRVAVSLSLSEHAQNLHTDVIITEPHSSTPKMPSLCAFHLAIGRSVRVEVTMIVPVASPEQVRVLLSDM